MEGNFETWEPNSTALLAKYKSMSLGPSATKVAIE